MILNEDRMNHSYHVAEYMYTHAAEYGLEAEKEQMYVVGLLHDVGSIRDKTRHEIAGGEILSQTGLKEEYLNAIAWHGKSPEDYCEHFGITQEDIPRYSSSSGTLISMWVLRARVWRSTNGSRT